MTKILKFLKGFDEEQRRSLAIFTALCLAESLVSASILQSLLTWVVSSYVAVVSECHALVCRGETIVKEGLSLEFATTMFQTWFKEKGKSHVGGALRKAGLEFRLLVCQCSFLEFQSSQLWYLWKGFPLFIAVICALITGLLNYWLLGSLLLMMLYFRNFFHQPDRRQPTLMSTSRTRSSPW